MPQTAKTVNAALAPTRVARESLAPFLLSGLTVMPHSLLADTETQIALETAARCADAARAAIMPHFRKGVAIDDKSDESPVTIADRQAEQAIRAVITARHPDHAIIGEEFGISGNAAQGWCWVIDPIDGTRAFITGRPSFMTLIALLHDGIPVLSIMDQPITGERWTGIADTITRYHAGAFGSGEVSATSRPCPSLNRAELACTSPDMLIAPWGRPFAQLKSRCKRTSWGGDAYNYGLLALGHLDLIAECTMKPWDWAALVPVVTGAGGSMTDWAGQPLRLDGDGTVLACGDPAMLPAAVRALSPDAAIG